MEHCHKENMREKATEIQLITREQFLHVKAKDKLYKMMTVVTMTFHN